MNYPRNANHQNEMFAMIKSSIESGINRKLFFKQQGISVHTYYYWYQKYKRSEIKSKDKFIPVVIEKPAKPAEQVTPKKTEIEVCYPNGVRIKLTQELNLPVLRSLIELI
jgi:hypothetical protein